MPNSDNDYDTSREDLSHETQLDRIATSLTDHALSAAVAENVVEGILEEAILVAFSTDESPIEELSPAEPNIRSEPEDALVDEIRKIVSGISATAPPPLEAELKQMIDNISSQQMRFTEEKPRFWGEPDGKQTCVSLEVFKSIIAKLEDPDNKDQTECSMNSPLGDTKGNTIHTPDDDLNNLPFLVHGVQDECNEVRIEEGSVASTESLSFRTGKQLTISDYTMDGSKRRVDTQCYDGVTACLERRHASLIRDTRSELNSDHVQQPMENSEENDGRFQTSHGTLSPKVSILSTASADKMQWPEYVKYLAVQNVNSRDSAETLISSIYYENCDAEIVGVESSDNVEEAEQVETTMVKETSPRPTGITQRTVHPPVVTTPTEPCDQILILNYDPNIARESALFLPPGRPMEYLVHVSPGIIHDKTFCEKVGLMEGDIQPSAVQVYKMTVDGGNRTIRSMEAGYFEEAEEGNAPETHHVVPTPNEGTEQGGEGQLLNLITAAAVPGPADMPELQDVSEQDNDRSKEPEHTGCFEEAEEGNAPETHHVVPTPNEGTEQGGEGQLLNLITARPVPETADMPELQDVSEQDNDQSKEPEHTGYFEEAEEGNAQETHHVVPTPNEGTEQGGEGQLLNLLTAPAVPEPADMPELQDVSEQHNDWSKEPEHTVCLQHEHEVNQNDSKDEMASGSVTNTTEIGAKDDTQHEAYDNPPSVGTETGVHPEELVNDYRDTTAAVRAPESDMEYSPKQNRGRFKVMEWAGGNTSYTSVLDASHVMDPQERGGEEISENKINITTAGVSQPCSPDDEHSENNEAEEVNMPKVVENPLENILNKSFYVNALVEPCSNRSDIIEQHKEEDETEIELEEKNDVSDESTTYHTFSDDKSLDLMDELKYTTSGEESSGEPKDEQCTKDDYDVCFSSVYGAGSEDEADGNFTDEVFNYDDFEMDMQSDSTEAMLIEHNFAEAHSMPLDKSEASDLYELYDENNYQIYDIADAMAPVNMALSFFDMDSAPSSLLDSEEADLLQQPAATNAEQEEPRYEADCGDVTAPTAEKDGRPAEEPQVAIATDDEREMGLTALLTESSSTSDHEFAQAGEGNVTDYSEPGSDGPCCSSYDYGEDAPEEGAAATDAADSDRTKEKKKKKWKFGVRLRRFFANMGASRSDASTSLRKHRDAEGE